VRIASAREKAGSALALPAALPSPGRSPAAGAVGRPSGKSPTSSGRRTRNSHAGTNPTMSTVAPTATHPARQPCSAMAAYAISGIAASPAMCARLTIALASGRRATNQVLSAP
jgi:hypothetical protein